MLFKVDTQFGHVIEDTPEGPVYRDDRSPVDPQNPRPCLGCNVRIANGTHDPCIANLPGTLNACCGHGLDKTPVHKNPSGYVALKDGRCFRFSGCTGGEKIRAAVDLALKGEDLPEGFVFDKDKAWWEGLTDAQRAYVNANTVRGLAELVTEAKGGEAPSAKFLAGEAMWWDGLDEAQKAYVWNGMKAKIAELVQEALKAA